MEKTKGWLLHSERVVCVHQCFAIDSDNTYGWGPFSLAKLQDYHSKSIFKIYKKKKKNFFIFRQSKVAFGSM